jgi:hypothetical protein
MIPVIVGTKKSFLTPEVSTSSSPGLVPGREHHILFATLEGLTSNHHPCRPHREIKNGFEIYWPKGGQ